MHGAEFVESLSVYGTTEYDKTAGSDVVIVPAGARQKPGETRLELVARNVAGRCIHRSNPCLKCLL